jgi:hypothetical protein
MAHSEDGGTLWVEPIKAAPESFLPGERLMPPKQLVMNSTLLKRMISPREKPPHVRHSTSVEIASVDECTIRTFRGKAHYKSPFLTRQLLVFSAPEIYGVVKITHSSSMVVLRTMKQIVIYPS